MKFKFNFKLTAFLVSLFISLIIVILGNKNQYCLSFGFMLMGVSLSLFVLYNNEKTYITIDEIDAQLDEVDLEMAEVDDELAQEEYAYVVKQLYLRRVKLLKRKKKVALTFYLCSALLVILGIIGLF